MASIAARYGFSDWQTIYDAPENAELKKKRKDPSVLCPGDAVVVPDAASKSVSCATGATHNFVVQRSKVIARLAVNVSDPFHYELIVAGRSYTGKTDGSAPLEHPIPPDVRKGELLLWPDEEGNAEARQGLLRIPIRFGRLDPLEEVSGIQGVLANLGFYFGAVDGILGDETKAAIVAFQEFVGMDPSGEIDDGLRDKLRGQHDR